MLSLGKYQNCFKTEIKDFNKLGLSCAKLRPASQLSSIPNLSSTCPKRVMNKFGEKNCEKVVKLSWKSQEQDVKKLRISNEYWSGSTEVALVKSF